MMVWGDDQRFRPARAVGEKGLGATAFGLITYEQTVRARQEVRPMNAISLWVLPCFCTVGD